MYGARKGAQTWEKACAVKLHIQRGADNFGEPGLAQVDIVSYYDTINCLRVARWIFDRMPADRKFWASCFLRLQILPEVCLTARDACSFNVSCRCLLAHLLELGALLQQGAYQLKQQHALRHRIGSYER
eukprot:TRINITY_DN47851_c0_g1_i1.p1 TRINITY_DN47851_c0_g1~~TRINITY_DN47851_c0_g1_i1.p1  ORF type:complete len:129 (+),score=21.49 TRINITY_DN47851_c0_g1_i1:338-724(+)